MDKSISTAKRKVYLAVAVLVTGLIAIITGAYLLDQNNPEKYEDPLIVRTIPNPDKSKVTKTIEMITDYPTYDSVEQMLKEKDLKFVGKVVISDNGMTVVRKINKDSNDTMVDTEYKARVETVIKGKNIKDNIVLSFVGGIDSSTRYVTEGVPQLKKDDVIIVFASLGGDGKYYPLSGSTAIAVQKSYGRFEMSKHTLNKGSFTFTEKSLEHSVKQLSK
ncbi:hypothetical protein CR956_00530 [Candidatus Saccharibacteria bacterium]|nr:MAG: hypothetical protein CR956_00530 [Candidatus Saccharibacteria bacterium]